MSQRGGRSGAAGRRPEPGGSWIDRIDWPLVAKGTWSAFFVLVLVWLTGPLVATIHPKAALVYLIVGAGAAFVVAGWRCAEADSPGLTGAVAAFLGYTLIIPLFYMAQRMIDVPTTVGTAVAALIVGGLAATLLARRS